MHLAVLCGNTRIVNKLILRGADQNIKDNLNKEPLDLAVERDF